MATVYRFPIFIWRNAADSQAVTVRMVDDGYLEALVTSDSVKDAVSQIKDYLHFEGREQSWGVFEPDFLDPELRVLKFSVLPEYQRGPRTFPCKESIRFRLPCITGKREAGSPIAFLPTLGVFFDYHKEDSFQALATHIAKRELSGKTPQELSPYLAPDEFELGSFSITIRDTEHKHDSWEREFRPLSEVADPMGQPEFRKLSRTWEREAAVDELVALLREENTSVCLVGDSGCGKTAVLAEAARQIERKAGEDDGKRRIFWMTSGARLIAGMRFLGQWEERLEEVIQQLAGIPGVLCLDNLAETMRLGGETAESSLAAFLVPYLQNGELRIVAEATPEELDACDRALPGLVDQLQVLKLAAFDGEQSKRIVHRAAEYHSQNDGVVFGPAGADRAHDLFTRFQPYVAFPGNVIQFMGGAVDRMADHPASEVPEIGPRQVEEAFADHTGLPGFLLRDDEPIDHEAMVARFREKLVGQDEAVATTCRTVAKFAAGLNDRNRPIGVLLFCGPTGVGKTQLVRFLGDFLFPNRPEKERIHRLDMSEYSGYDAAERLLGRAHGEPSALIRSIRTHPFSVLLLDEIEKASDEVFDIFLNVFEEGRLTDPLGRVTAFNSTLIVMTSNLGAGGSGTVGFSSDGAAESVAEVDRSAVLNLFRPEVFTRLDRIVYFRPLGRESIEVITRKELNEIAGREGLAERGLTLRFGGGLVAALAERGFDPVYGARPLQRAIEETVTLPLSRWLTEPEQASLENAAIEISWTGESVGFAV